MVTSCVSISAVASLVDNLIGIASSAVGLKICVIIAGIKKYEPVIKERSKKHDKLVFLAQNKLNAIGVLISKDLNDSCINHGEFVSANNIWKSMIRWKKQ